ncbi:helicase-related protein [Bifidobacterium sp. ESL0790]|uniref:helicase-related protein n=1 Tax=Bifidobacterium sp. ESL0790 TaxID=2983233 RepID=UPI0023F6B7F5|nr:helicase-related protein [Bifidobacterium sp. ESL0790]WEV72000.1 helicase-related protein [Bifidobacterium sp. ESL0790]
MMSQDFFDNKTVIVKDDLVRRLHSGDRIAVAASIFSVYAYEELKEQLEQVDDFRFIFTDEAFTPDIGSPKEKREFYIPKLEREQGLYGTKFEVRLRNELTQKAIAVECADWIRRKATFKSLSQSNGMPTFLSISDCENNCMYSPFDEFSTSQLGTSKPKSKLVAISRQEGLAARGFLNTFDQAWNSGELSDVTETVISRITQMYQENSPETIYYLALYRIFHEFLEDVDEDTLPKEGTGYRKSRIWNTLYDFQKDAAIAIINKLETYNGCILADSVGLGKTYTALAVIKYFQSRNCRILVLCPKKLESNWTSYTQNLTSNPLVSDKLRYDVLAHSDLSRDGGTSTTGMPLDQVSWGNYDLVVIDESHNFRNGADNASKNDDKQNRYQKLKEKVIKQGVNTKVLMLSATPVNNRFRDLQNQLALAYEGSDKDWQESIGLHNDLDTIFRQAQQKYNEWSKLDEAERTTTALTNMLDFDFFKILDQVTVARSRKHIQSYYDMNAIGPFPKRRKPLSYSPALSVDDDSLNYDMIYERLEQLNLMLYSPSSFLLSSKVSKYFDEDGQGLTTAGREEGIKQLMATNLLKRFESSVDSFRKTLQRISGFMEQTCVQIDAYEQKRNSHAEDGKDAQFGLSDVEEGFDLDQDDDDEMDFTTQGKNRFSLSDMDWKTWRGYIRHDIDTIHDLLELIQGIDAEHDAKLQQLLSLIQNKAENPFNTGNKKVLIFTAFADTADYLYQNVSGYAQSLGLETAEVTGAQVGRSTMAQVGGDMTSILASFSPVSKNRDQTAPKTGNASIDILIATDCISEGQNLQDCDEVINYDIHWNPVRIVQRFGRVDRIGSPNKEIQLVNFWPATDLDKYLNLKDRVKNRMKAAVMSATGDDDPINEEEQGGLAYRSRQLKEMRTSIPDLEDIQGGVSITDLGLNEFRMDLIDYHKNNPNIEYLPSGIDAVVEGEDPGVIFVLRNINGGVNINGSNRLHPFYLVYARSDGSILHGHLDPKATLDMMRILCKGKDRPDETLYRPFNRETKNGKDMHSVSLLLQTSVESIVFGNDVNAMESFFGDKGTSFLDKDVQGLDDFELICFLVVRAKRR